MTDVRELIQQRLEDRAAELAGNDTYEAKHQRAMDRLEAQLIEQISSLRVYGLPPVNARLSPKHQALLRAGSRAEVNISMCRFCNPPPKTFKCVLCDQHFGERWKMWLHNTCSPKWCQDWAEKKARHWSRQA
ncbi:hypothetical protein SEA_LITTLELAF_30 [Mycobacterium phage LittleLaf]|uniref:Uncharacterized protein n=7 Tax=Marvinvirus TaxID=1982091 RepID=G1BN99_9CAUD|nr:hypothetical protein FDI61_gp029 [Mycobacterium phage Marvin]AVE00776.1 hypothetical protein SEA_TESLA_30 [Mycobacterium phage Tesla]AYB69837.1 hypothetical protein SEA_LITTLELAF_30 [Mycobacterium phage LittleLaf]AYB70667.1 hypothetical protein SEA_VASUNZINGA_30 [Mycobacterium phage VasuNzinga]QAX93082.1 hypothetical protein SEA_REDRAIDER77_31 [Mycobacterium phage RedRaider77]QFP94170.1 hypothetical protein SEA_JOIEB_31 [Mycobacterium phage JoieB]QFP97585.1 hypothetical protein SEA_CORAZON